MLGDIEVEISNRVGLEGLLRGFVALDLRQPVDVVALKEAVKGRPGEMWDRRLQRIKAIIERQQRMLAESDGDGLFLRRQHRRSRHLRPHGGVLDEVALLPFSDGLGIETVALG